jgi:hypothetical protein
MKLRFSKVTLASSAAAVIATGGAAMAATGTLPGVLTSDSVPATAAPARTAANPPRGEQPRVPSAANAPLPDPKVPDVPDTDKNKVKLPADPVGRAVPKPSCRSLPPAVKVGDGTERAFTSAAGLRYSDVKAGHMTIGGGREVCKVTQTWVSRVNGQSLKVTSLSRPSDAKLADLARGLRIVNPQASNVGGHTALAGSPSDTGGHGMLWAENPNRAVYVSGGSGLPGGTKEQVNLVSKALQRVR